MKKENVFIFFLQPPEPPQNPPPPKKVKSSIIDEGTEEGDFDTEIDYEDLD